MEGLGARLCAERCTQAQLDELQDVCDAGIHTEDPGERVAINSRFHTMIAEFSGNERVADYLADFREMVNRDMYISTSDKTRTISCDLEHQQIMEAIHDRNGELAEKRMRAHVRNAFVFKKAHAELLAKQKEE